MAISAGMGLSEFPFSGGKAFWQWVEMCETGKVDSIWQSDRVVSKEPHLECMSVMAALAGATQRLKFGMNVASVGLRDPLLLAKQCATIDVLSNGRLLPAFGVGSPRAAEWKVTGRESKGAGAMAEEGMEIIWRLWREESVTFRGKHFQLEGATISPRPVQPELPLWIGGSSDAALRRTGRIGTGWQAAGETPDEIPPVLAKIRGFAAEYGRKIDFDHFGAGVAFRLGKWDEPIVARQAEAYQKRTGRDPKLGFAVGDTRVLVERIQAYVDAGISKFILRPMGRDDADFIDQTRRVIDEVLPEVARMNAAQKEQIRAQAVAGATLR